MEKKNEKPNNCMECAFYSASNGMRFCEYWAQDLLDPKSQYCDRGKKITEK